MTLNPITEGLPSVVTNQLLNQESVLYFSYISHKGGCLSSSDRDEYWIAMTNKRVLYKAKILENNSAIERDGILPLEKISFVEVTDAKLPAGCGCSSTQAYGLRISTSGGTIIIPLPTKDKGYEIRKAYSEIVDTIKNSHDQQEKE